LDRYAAIETRALAMKQYKKSRKLFGGAISNLFNGRK